MMYDTLRYDEGDCGVVTLTLNRPSAANAITAEMAAELLDAAQRCQTHQARVVVLAATGRFFCAGGDLGGFAALGEGLPVALRNMAADLNAALLCFAGMDAPLIAAVNGTAAGAGLSLVCAADIAVAAESARFVSAYTAAGLTPDGGATYALVRHVGLRRAQELVLTNRVLTAAEALSWGLLTRVVAEDSLQEEVAGLARSFAEGATGALGASKRLLHAAWLTNLQAQLDAEADGVAAAAGGPEGTEGIGAFLAKRAPAFRSSASL